MALPYGKAVSANAYKNNGATVMYGGNVPTGNTNSLDYTYIGRRSFFPGPKVVTGRTGKALSGGDFAYQVAGKWVMVGGNVTATLAGVANTSLLSGAADFGRRSINKMINLRSTFVTAWSWTMGSTTTYTATKSNKNIIVGTVGVSNQYGNDNEATSSRTLPGELTYMKGAVAPVNADYPARTA